VHSLTRIITRRWYRSRLFWALVLVSSYTITGFLVLPGIINNIAIENIKQNLGWDASIEKVELNPYALTLTIHNLQIQNEQKETVISFSRFHNDIELRSIVEGAVTFSSLELVDPFIKLSIEKNGKTNFHNAIEQAQAEKTQETSPEPVDESKLIQLLFDDINVVDGSIEIADNSLSTQIEHKLKPINFNLKNFSTHMDEGGDYQLNIAVGTGQTINWRGNVRIAPFRSNGFLKVTNIRAHRLWAYVEESAPYTLANALVAVDGQYEVSMAGDTPHLVISNTTVTLDEVKVATSKNHEPFVDITKIVLGPLDFDLEKKELDISKIAIDSVALKIDRNAQGELDLLAPFASLPDKPESDVSETDNAEPFKWSIGKLLINNSQLNIADHQPAMPANIEINNINAHINGLSQDLSKNLGFGLSYLIQNSGKSDITGKIIPVPFSLKAALNLDDIALATIQPYLNEQVKMTIEEGTLSIDGDLNLSSKEDTVNGGFEGSINIDQFNTSDQTVNQRLVGWKHLTITPIKINFNPLAIDISDIRLEEPYGRIIVTEDRSTNLSQLVVAPKPAQQKAVQKKEQQTSDSKTSPPIPITIDRILLNNGAAYFADLSLKPQFGTGIQNINGEISGLSSDNLERANVSIKGTIEDYGKALIKGKVNPLSGDLYTDLDVKFNNIELSTLTAYSGRYAGYAIEKGKLSLHLNYKIANRMLDGNNKLIIDQLELGTTVDSEESVSLPLELALAILKDRNGIIDIDLPTKGDMDDPEFKISGLVIKAFLNVITKAVTAPFSMLGNLVGGDSDSLSSVAFEAGNADLGTEQIANLAVLSDALKERPQLMLEIRAMVDQEADGKALKELKLNKQINTGNIQQRIASMESLVSKRSGQTELEQLKTSSLSVPNANQAQAKKTIDTVKYEKSLYHNLLTTEQLTSLELTTLAKQRISSIKTQLIDQNGVANEQVFALNPSLEGKADNNVITTTFSLKAR